MKSLVSWFFKLLTWAVAIVFMVELVSFAVVSVSNYIVYGHIREGSRVMYDPYSLFRKKEGPRATTQFPAKPDQKKYTIWMFGGSTTRGAVEEDNHTIASQLAAALNTAESTTHYTVRNFGENSYNSLLEVKYLQEQLIENAEKPDLIFFYDGINESVYFAQHRSADAHHGYRRVRALIESYYKSFFGVLKPINAAILASFSKELYDKLNQVYLPLEKDDPELKRHLTLAGKRYEYANKVAACYGAKFALVWQPALWSETCEINETVKKQELKHFINTDRFTSMRDNFLTVNSALADALKKRSYFIDYRSVLCPRTTSTYLPDGAHLTAAGDEMVGKQLAITLREKGLLE
jgi:lysophospholipase L1-like esterase